jgi:hypothetical protein
VHGSPHTFLPWPKRAEGSREPTPDVALDRQRLSDDRADCTTRKWRGQPISKRPRRRIESRLPQNVSQVDGMAATRSPQTRSSETVRRGDRDEPRRSPLARRERRGRDIGSKTSTRQPRRDSLFDIPAEPGPQPHDHALATPATRYTYRPAPTAIATGAPIRHSANAIPHPNVTGPRTEYEPAPLRLALPSTAHRQEGTSSLRPSDRDLAKYAPWETVLPEGIG